MTLLEGMEPGSSWLAVREADSCYLLGALHHGLCLPGNQAVISPNNPGHVGAASDLLDQQRGLGSMDVSKRAWLCVSRQGHCGPGASC